MRTGDSHPDREQRCVVGELMERVTGAAPDQFHGAILDWLTAQVGCDSSVFMPAPDRGLPPVERNKDAFVRRFLQGLPRYLPCLRKSIAAVKRDGVFVDHDVYSCDERQNLPFYAEVIRPQGISSQLVIGISFQRRYRGTFHLCRHGQVGAFRSSIIRRIAAVIPAIGLIDAAASAAPAAAPPAAPPPAPCGDGGLGPREREVADLAARGLETKEIATLLGTRPATVRNQLHAIFRKLDVSNRTELAFTLAGSASS